MAEEETLEEEVVEEETTEEVADDGDEGDDSTEGPDSGEQEEGEEGEEEKAEETESDDEVELKVYGQTVKVSRDKLKDLAAKGLGADAKFQSVNEEKQKVLQIIDDIKARPFEILGNLGVDVRKMAEDFLIQKMEEENLNEDQKRALAAENENKTLKAERAKIEAERKEKEQAVAISSLREQIEEECITALNDVSIPKNEVTVARMASYMAQGEREGITVTASQAAKLVQQDIIDETKTIYGNTPVEKLKDFLGADVIKKIKNYDLSQIKTPQDKNKVDDGIDVVYKPKKQQGGKTQKQLKAELDAAFGGDPWEEKE